jgi:formylglycine-generating enzyme required for sulfatase activity
MSQEMPQHPVHIDKPFGLGKYPITRGEFAAFVQETNYKTDGDCTQYHPHAHYAYQKVPGSDWQNPGFDQSDRDPVVCVNIHDVEAYIAWLNTKVKEKDKKDGVYRLPSEAEWEYAARAGTQMAYWWGDTIRFDQTVCNICGSRWDDKRPAPVGSFKPNPFGLYDVHGNVWEWTADCWNKSYSGAPSDGSAWKAGDCEKRAMRSGGWGSDAWVLRSADRGSPPAEDKDNEIGFRVAQELPPSDAP